MYLLFIQYSFEQIGLMKADFIVEKIACKKVCVCATKFLIQDVIVWRVLTVIWSHRNIYK